MKKIAAVSPMEKQVSSESGIWNLIDERTLAVSGPSLSDADLLGVDEELHRRWKERSAAGKPESEDLLNDHIFVWEEMLRRKIKHPDRDDTLMERTTAFMAEFRHDLRKIYRMDEVEALHAKLPEKIVIAPDFVQLTGSYLYAKDRKPNDLDILVRQNNPDDRVGLKLFRMLSEISGGVRPELLWNEAGSNWSFAPLYALVLEKLPLSITTVGDDCADMIEKESAFIFPSIRHRKAEEIPVIPIDDDPENANWLVGMASTGETEKGGEGSGDFGHLGRSGDVGGSGSGGGSATSFVSEHGDAIANGKPKEVAKIRDQFFAKEGFTKDDIKSLNTHQNGWMRGVYNPDAQVMRQVAASEYNRNWDTDEYHDGFAKTDARPTEKQAAIVKANREFVVASLRAKYGDEITVYRGVRGDQATALRSVPPGGKAEIGVNSLSSWTMSEKAANRFAQTQDGVVIKQKIKVADIWGSAHASTEFSIGEKEVVVGFRNKTISVSADDIKPFKVGKSADPFLDYPDTDEPQPFVMQLHFRGSSAHADLRLAMNDHLTGWTLALALPEKIAAPVETMEDAENIIDDNEAFKVDLETGEFREREVGETGSGEPIVRATSIQAFKKDLQPLQWLSVEGVIPKGGIGATLEFPGVFKIIDKGTFSHGVHKSDVHEYFLDGDVFSGRFIFRLLELGKGDGGEIVGKIVLPPSEEQSLSGGGSWLMIQPDDQMPYVLSERAIKDKPWIPPQGQSALPPDIRDEVPDDLRYWLPADESERMKLRDALVETWQEDGTLDDIAGAADGEDVEKTECDSDASRLVDSVDVNNIYSSADDIPQKPKGRSMATIDIFAGAGGMTLGLKRAGFNTACGIEFDVSTAVTWAHHNSDSSMLCQDITKIDLGILMRKLPDIEMICGGPPCQGFSNATGLGKYRNDPAKLAAKRRLFYQSVRLLKTFKPKGFIFENVGAIKNAPAFPRILGLLRKSGYRIGWKIYEATAWNVPQMRKRMIIMGIRSSEKDDLELPDYPAKDIVIGPYLRNLGRPNSGDDPLHIHSNTGKEMISLCEKTPCGEEVANLRCKLSPNRPANTVIGDKSNFHWKNRPLTLREQAIIQGFPRRHRFFGTRTQVQRQIGNAVPPAMAKGFAEIYKQLLTQVKKTDFIPEYPDSEFEADITKIEHDEIVRMELVSKKFPKDGKFILQRRSWKVRDVVREGPSHVDYFLRFHDTDGKISTLLTDQDPREGDTGGTLTRGGSEKLMTADGVIPPGDPLGINPLKVGDITVEILDQGNFTISLDNNEIAGYKLDGAVLRGDYELSDGGGGIFSFSRIRATEKDAHDDMNTATTLQRAIPIAKTDDEKRLIYGIVYEPEIVDSQAEWGGLTAIENACHKFMERYNRARALKLMHNSQLKEEAAIVECYIMPQDGQIGDQKVRKGTWVLVTKIHDDKLWKKVKSGEIAGYSMGGKARGRTGEPTPVRSVA